MPNLPAVRHHAPAPSRARRWWIGGAVALVLRALGGLAYVQFWMPGPPLVAVEIAGLSPVTRVLAVNGRIAAERSVDVRSVVSGTLIELPVAEGDRVAEGQVVARVDAAAQNALVRQAMAGLDAALVARQRAVEAYDRNVALGSNVSRTALENSAHDVEAATQEVARQTAVVDQATIVLDNRTIRAPSAGQVLTLEAEQGQIVGPTPPLMTIADPGALVVEADVDEAYATQIALGQPAVLQLVGDTGTHAGRIAYVSSRVDADTGGLAVRIALDEAVAVPIGLMQAMGAPRRFVVFVFVTQGALIGLMGGLSGAALGYVALLPFPTRDEFRPGTLPMDITQGSYGLAIALTVLGAILASILPARSAAKVDPVTAIGQ